MRDRCAEGTCMHVMREPKTRPQNPEPLVPAPKKSRPQILMTIKDRNVTVFTCDTSGCNWSRIALGTPSRAEGEALEHLKTHEPEGK